MADHDARDSVPSGKPGCSIPVGKLRARAAGSAAETVYALILSGSLNPLHRSHVECLESARRGLEAQGLSVVAGYLVPSSEQYVNMKLGKEAMPLAKRVAVCQRWAEDSDWIDVLGWGWASGSHIQAALDGGLAGLAVGDRSVNVASILVFGADFVAKTRNYRGRLCCVARGDRETADVRKAVEKGLTAPFPEFSFVTGSESSCDKAHSSTAVRAAVKRRDAAALRTILPATVAAMLYPWAAPRRRVKVVGIFGPSGVGKSTLAKAVTEALDLQFHPVSLDCYIDAAKVKPTQIAAIGADGDSTCCCAPPKRNARAPKPPPPSGMTVSNWEDPAVVNFTQFKTDLQALIATVECATPEALATLTPGMAQHRKRPLHIARRPIRPDEPEVTLVCEGYLLAHDPALAAMFDERFFLEASKDICSQRRGAGGRALDGNPLMHAHIYDKLVWARYEANLPGQLQNTPNAVRLDAEAEVLDLVQELRAHLS
eukprot:TRINITY_DN4781_c0_g2_i1.p1 TRINITY_DN4781_c0_g2~~TRINITY_DN4781_c0_g2_i1.p1  ORF type:complete len:486 (+),score=139.06 TRINITY_DN4781_c0_g2_i1:45-1502(+)